MTRTEKIIVSNGYISGKLTVIEYIGKNLYGHRRYLDYRNSAKKRNMKFELTQEECFILFESPCKYCGSKPSPINGIDRVDSSIGYNIKNCVPCCTECNRSKWDYTESKFYSNIKRIYEHLHLENYND